MSDSEQPFDQQQSNDWLVATDDERLWAMLAHLCGFLGHSVVLGQYLGPFFIYLYYKEKSRYVAYHALQSLYFQLLLLALFVASGLLSLVTCGVLIPLWIAIAILVGVAAIVCPIIAAYNSYQGKSIEYWLVGAWAREQAGV